MASAAWHFAQEGGTGPALHSVSIQRETCCPGMGRDHIEETLGRWAFHTYHLPLPCEMMAVPVSQWQTASQRECENGGGGGGGSGMESQTPHYTTRLPHDAEYGSILRPVWGAVFLGLPASPQTPGDIWTPISHTQLHLSSLVHIDF